MTKTKINIAGIGGVGGYFSDLLADHYRTNKNVGINFFPRGGQLRENKNGLKVINNSQNQVFYKSVERFTFRIKFVFKQ